MDSGKISVIPPGIALEKWNFKRTLDSAAHRPVRLLFVGGDFEGTRLNRHKRAGVRRLG